MEINSRELNNIGVLLTDMDISSKQVKRNIFAYDADVNAALEAAQNLVAQSESLVDIIEDALMGDVDVDIDSLFVHDPASDYVKAVTDFLLGVEGAEDRMDEALAKLEEQQAEEEPEEFSEVEFLEALDDLDDYYYGKVADNLEAIDEFLAGKDPFAFNRNELEMARYLLRFVNDSRPSEVDGLSDVGVAMAWKRRMLNGAAK